MIPERWFDVTRPGLDEERLVCSNCFAATTRPRIFYGWQASRSPDWDDDEDEKARNASEPLAGRVSLPDPDPRPHLISKLFAAIARRKRRVGKR